jgi:hypothetical protein
VANFTATLNCTFGNRAVAGDVAVLSAFCALRVEGVAEFSALFTPLLVFADTLSVTGQITSTTTNNGACIDDMAVLLAINTFLSRLGRHCKNQYVSMVTLV